MTDKENIAEDLMNHFIMAREISQKAGDWKFYKEVLIDSQKLFTQMYAKSKMEAAQDLYAEVLNFIKDQLAQIKLAENKAKIPF